MNSKRFPLRNHRIPEGFTLEISRRNYEGNLGRISEGNLKLIPWRNLRI